jgi:hypothetical protein
MGIDRLQVQSCHLSRAGLKTMVGQFGMESHFLSAVETFSGLGLIRKHGWCVKAFTPSKIYLDLFGNVSSADAVKALGFFGEPSMEFLQAANAHQWHDKSNISKMLGDPNLADKLAIGSQIQTLVLWVAYFIAAGISKQEAKIAYEDVDSILYEDTDSESDDEPWNKKDAPFPRMGMIDGDEAWHVAASVALFQRMQFQCMKMIGSDFDGDEMDVNDASALFERMRIINFDKDEKVKPRHVAKRMHHQKSPLRYKNIPRKPMACQRRFFQARW